MTISLFWDATPCSLKKILPEFRRNLLFQLPSPKLNVKDRRSRSPETLVNVCQTARRHIPEEANIRGKI
jgi:hypothetical protein